MEYSVTYRKMYRLQIHQIEASTASLCATYINTIRKKLQFNEFYTSLYVCMAIFRVKTFSVEISRHIAIYIIMMFGTEDTHLI